MKTLVTGGSGFIGSYVLEKLKLRGHETYNFDLAEAPELDITDAESVNLIVEHFKPNVIFHLAGALGTAELVEDPVRAEFVNVIGTLHILAACWKHKIPLVFASKINPSDWINPYTITKRACDSYCQMYRLMGMKICIIKPTNVYGPRQTTEIQKCVPIFIKNALAGDPLPVYGTGEQLMDSIYVEDVAEAFVRSWERQCWGKIIEVGSGKSVTVLEMAEKILELTTPMPALGWKSKIQFLPMRFGEPQIHKQSTIANTWNLNKLLDLGEKNMMTLDEGLLKTIDWWRRQQ
jgi:UDP-glucose 4-epimerase